MLKAGVKSLLKKSDGGGGVGRGRSRSPFRRRGRSKSKSRGGGGGGGGDCSKNNHAVTAHVTAGTAEPPATPATTSTVQTSVVSPESATPSSSTSPSSLTVPTTVGISSPPGGDDCTAGNSSAGGVHWSSNVVSPDAKDGTNDDKKVVDDDTFLRMQTARYSKQLSAMRSLSPLSRRNQRPTKEADGNGNNKSKRSKSTTKKRSDSPESTASSHARLGIGRPRYGVSLPSSSSSSRRTEEDDSPLLGYTFGMAPPRDGRSGDKNRIVEEDDEEEERKGKGAIDGKTVNGSGMSSSGIVGGRSSSRGRAFRNKSAATTGTGGRTRARSRSRENRYERVGDGYTEGEAKAAAVVDAIARQANKSSAVVAGKKADGAAATTACSTPTAVRVPSVVRAIEKKDDQVGGTGKGANDSKVTMATTAEADAAVTDAARNGDGTNTSSNESFASPDRFFHLPTAKGDAKKKSGDKSKVATGRSFGGGTRAASSSDKDVVFTNKNKHKKDKDKPDNDDAKRHNQPIFLLLLEPTQKIFELIRIEYDATTATVGDILNLIKFHSTEPSLARQDHVGLVRPRDSALCLGGPDNDETTMNGGTALAADRGTLLTNLTARASGSAYGSARIKRGEILVPLPRECDGDECRVLANTILQTPSLVRLLDRDDPLGDHQNGKAAAASKNKRRKKKKGAGGSNVSFHAGKDGAAAASGRTRHHHHHHRSSAAPSLVPVVEDDEGSRGAGGSSSNARRGDAAPNVGGAGTDAPEASAAEVEEIRRAALDAASVAAANVLERRMGEIERRILVASGRRGLQQGGGGDGDDEKICEEEMIRLEIERTIEAESQEKARRDLEDQVRRDVEQRAQARSEIEDRIRREAEERNMTAAERIERMAMMAERGASRSISPLFSGSEGDTPCASPPDSFENSPPTSPQLMKLTSSALLSDARAVTAKRELASDFSREAGVDGDAGGSLAIVAETIASLFWDGASVVRPPLRRLRNTVRKVRSKLSMRSNKQKMLPIVLAVAAASLAIATALFSGRIGLGGARPEIPSTSGDDEEQQQRDPLGIIGLLFGSSFLIFLVRFQSVARKRTRAAAPPPTPMRRKGRMVKGMAIPSIAPSSDATIQRRYEAEGWRQAGKMCIL